jgi:hypothetical protein
MNLTESKRTVVVETALTYLNQPYRVGFRCTEFAREVYRSVGIEIPKLKTYAPPRELNLSPEEFMSPRKGSLIFLKDRHDPRKERAWTHVVICLSTHNCIHNSRFYGKVCISSFLELTTERYDFTESNPA